MGKTPAEDRYLVPGLMRGLEVLRAFTPERGEMTLSDIARQLGLSRSAAFRAVYTLSAMGYLLHDAHRQSYTLGPAILTLGYGSLASRDLVEAALPALEDLRDITDWSTHLGARDGRSVLYMLRMPAQSGVSSIVHVGSRLPAADTTLGRVLLADLDEDEIVALFRDGPGAARRPRARADLMAQWRADRSAATVTQIGEFQSGVASVAAPVRDRTGRVVAAVSATQAATPERLEALDRDIRPALLRTAAQLSRRLGAQ